MIVHIGKRLLFMVMFLIALIAGCIIDNGDDEKKESGPSVESLNISEGQIVDSRDLSVSWKGAGGAEEYKYILDGTSSAWFDTTAVTLTDLDEAIHELSIVARRDTVTSKPLTVTFEVDALHGPGILFSPRKVTGVSYVNLSIEDADSLMAAHIVLEAEGGSGGFMSFQPDGALEGGGTAVVFYDTSVQGRLVVDVGFAGLPQGARGRVTVGKFILRPLLPSGTVVVDSLATEFRDVNNAPVLIQGYDTVRIGQ